MSVGQDLSCRGRPAILVAAFVFFPSYVGALLGGEGIVARDSADAPHAIVMEFDVQGMFCEECAALLRSKLAAIPGVASGGANVSYAQALATVVAENEKARQQVIDAAAEIGFTANAR